MSKAIPKVRTWRVRYYQGDKCRLAVLVDAPNKQFARWNARDELMYRGDWLDVWEKCDRITVAPVEIKVRLVP